MTRPIPDLLLERLRLGELDPVAAAEIEARLDPATRARLDRLDADDAALLDALPPRVVAAEVERRRRSHRVRPTPFVGLALAGAAAAAAVLLWPRVEPPPIAVEDTVRAKGDARLLIYRQAGAAPELLAEGSRAGEGDVIQLGVLLDEAQHAAVISIDGRGAVTVHHPTTPETTALPAGRLVFDHAFALDDAPAFERFFLVTAPEPIGADVLREAVEALGDPADDPLSLPRGWHVSATLIEKEVR